MYRRRRLPATPTPAPSLSVATRHQTKHSHHHANDSRAQALQALMGRRTCEGEVPPETCTVEAWTGRGGTGRPNPTATSASACFHCMVFHIDDVDDARDVENMLRADAASAAAWDSGCRAPVTVAMQFGRERLVSRVRVQSASTAAMARHELWLNRCASPPDAALLGVYEGPVEDKEWLEFDLLPLSTPATAKEHKHQLMERLRAQGVTVRTTLLTGGGTVAWYALRADELRVHPSFSTASGLYEQPCPCGR